MQQRERYPTVYLIEIPVLSLSRVSFFYACVCADVKRGAFSRDGQKLAAHADRRVRSVLAHAYVFSRDYDRATRFSTSIPD